MIVVMKIGGQSPKIIAHVCGNGGVKSEILYQLSDPVNAHHLNIHRVTIKIKQFGCNLSGS